MFGRLGSLAVASALLVACATGCSAGADEPLPEGRAGYSATTEGGDTSSPQGSGWCGSSIVDDVYHRAASGPAPFQGFLTSSTNRVTGGPYVGGVAIMNAMESLILSARHDVLIEFYDIDTDSWMAHRLQGILEKVQRQVKVYILVNPASGATLGVLPESTDATLSRLRGLFGDNPRVTVGAFAHSQGLHMLEVMHTKQVVVDGARALMTDSNLQPNADPVEEGGHEWYQLGVTIEGSIASSLAQESIAAWGEATPHVELDVDTTPKPATSTCTPMVVLGRKEGVGEESSADQGYAALFGAARKDVLAITPNLNDDGALKALGDATAHADVYVVLSRGFNDTTENLPTRGGTNEENVGRLADMALDKCRLHVRWYAHEEGAAVDGNVDYASHAKWASADGRTMILGSQNLDTQSWKTERELSLAIDDAATTAKFDAEFHRVWSRSVMAYEGTGCTAR